MQRAVAFRMYRPEGDGSLHFQASILASTRDFGLSQAAADALRDRRFAAQVFEVGPCALEAAHILRAADCSSRLVIVDRAGARRIAAFAAKELKCAGIAIPLLRLELPRLRFHHVMEACLRNLE